jgi:hypothetical protein
MPVLAKFCGIVIRLLSLPSLGPRLHAFYGDDELVLNLEDLRVVSGHMPDRIARMIITWARHHRDEILAGISALPVPGRS